MAARKILHVNMGYPPAKGLGGPTKSVSSVAAEQVRRGAQVSVVCTNLHDKRNRIYSETVRTAVSGVDVHYLRTLTVPLWPGTIGPLWVPDLFPFLREHLAAYDLVHFHGVRDTLAYFTAMAAARRGIPYLLQAHGELPYLGMRTLKRTYDRLFTARVFKHAAGFLALSDQEASECRAMYPSTPVDVIANGLDPGHFSPLPGKGFLRGQLGVPPDCPIVLFLGRLNWIKGVDLLLESFAQCREMSRLVLVGPDEGIAEEMRTLARTLNIQDRVHFFGPVPPEDVLKAFVDADLFVLTSRKELFPYAVMESCGAGVPIVMTSVCEIADKVADKAALVVPPDPAAVAAAIDRLLIDQALRASLSAGGKVLSGTMFSIMEVVDEIEQIYDRVLCRRQTA